MEKIWFIKVNDAETGPFSLAELKCHPDITPDTLVRKEGRSLWTPMRHVAELKKVFEDAPPVTPKPSSENHPENNVQVEKDELLLDASYDTPPFLFWLLLLIVLFYTSYQLYLKR